jgi:L-fuculose-phosphate aldolase
MQARSKGYYHERVEDEMAQLATPAWSVRQRLALSCRMLAAEGHWRGIAGQITARAEQPGRFLTLGFGVGYDEATASTLVEVDDDLTPLQAGTMPNPATRFHLWVYNARPDVSCIVHTHPPAVSALSMTGESIAVAHMDATPFFEDCAYLAEWPGLPIADNEGEIISRALTDKRAILLAHHGLLTAGATVEEAVVMAIWLEHAAEMQLRARALGPLKTIKPERAREAHDFLVKPKVTELTFAYFARRALRADPGCIV